MGLGKKGSGDQVKKKTTNNEVIIPTSQSVDSSEETTCRSSTSTSSTVVTSSRVVQEERTSAETETRHNVVEMIGGSREVIMDSKGNIVKVIESAPRLIKDINAQKYTTRGGKMSDEFIEDEKKQIVMEEMIKNKDVKNISNIVGNDNKLSEEISGHRESRVDSSMSHIISSSSVTEEASSYYSDDHSTTQNPNIRTSSQTSEHKDSSKIVSEGRQVDGQIYIDTKKVNESEIRLDIDGNVVSSRSKNIKNESTVEPAGKSGHVMFVDDKKSSVKCIPSMRPGESAWDGKFVHEKQTETPGLRTPISQSSDTSILTKNTAGDVRSSSETRETSHIEESISNSSMSELISSSHTSDIRKSSITTTSDLIDSTDQHCIPTRYIRQGDSAWDGSFVKESTSNTNASIKKSHEPTVVRTSDKRRDSFEIKDVTEDQNIVESSITSYIVEYKDASDRKRTEKVTSVSAVIPEEDGSPSPRGASTPKRPGSPEKTSRPDSRCSKPGQSTWDGSFVYEKPQTINNTVRYPADSTQSPQRNYVKRTDIDIRDVTDDHTINDADIITTSYVVETSESQKSFSDTRDSSITSVWDRTDIPREKRPGSPEKVDRDSIKLGSSTWDGTFRKPESMSKSSPVSRRPNVSDTTLDLREYHDAESTEIISESFVVEQSCIHESYTDSSNIDLSSTAVETVIIVDGTPVSSTKDRIIGSTISPDSSLKQETVIKTDGKQLISDKKSSYPEDRTARPTKPGSSTWDGSFTYEKPVDSTVDNKKPGTIDKTSNDVFKQPLKHNPTDVDDKLTLNTIDVSKTVTSSEEFILKEKSTDSKRIDSTNITKTIYDKPIGPQKNPQDKPSPQRPESPEKSPDDKNVRPTKPGSSTWDGSFVYEKPVNSKRPSDVKPENIKHPLNKKQQSEDIPHPTDRQSVSVSDFTTNIVDITDDVSSTTTEFINVERSTIDSKIFDSTNTINTTVHDVKSTKRPTGPELKPVGVKERPNSPDKGNTSPGDRTTRPSKPGSSTWDGSFVNETPVDSKRPSNVKPQDLKRPADKKQPQNITSPIDRRPVSVNDVKRNIVDVSDDISSTTIEFINVEKSSIDSKTTDTTVVHDAKPTNKRVGSGPRPDEVKDGPHSPSKTDEGPVDRSIRPSKPGSSTWDGSFTYEKPKEPKKTN